MNSTVTLEEWMDYHAGVSANIDEDDAFGIMMAHNWGIKYIPKKDIENIMDIIRTKAEQKGGNKNPKRTAADIFKSIDFKEFCSAMDQFGAGLDKAMMETFFGM